MKLLSAVLILLAALLPLAAVAQLQDDADALEVLRRLVEIPGVSGFEGPVRDQVRAFLPAWTDPEIDDRGNLIVSFGEGPEHLFFVGHLDEVGYVVTAINDDGTLSVERPGGSYDTYYEARPIVVYTSRGPITGIIQPRPGYIQASTGDPDAHRIRDVRVYLGTETRVETEDLGIRQGDSITVPKRLVPMTGDRATARSFDDRSGCTAMVLALMRLDPELVNKRITFAWVVEEEVGLNGARALAERSAADYVFAVDTFVTSDSPPEDRLFADDPLGRGFVIRALDRSNVTPIPIVNRVLDIARRHNIPAQTGTTNGGNEGSAFTRFGAIDIPISWPGSYSHSPIEVLDKKDLEVLIDIIHRLVLEF